MPTRPEKPESGTHWPPDAAYPPGGMYSVRVEWRLFDGRWEPKSIKVTTLQPDETGPVTGTTLRELPIGRITDYMRSRAIESIKRHVERGVDVPDGLTEAWERGERPKLGVEHYQQVADIYKAAFAAGASPTKVVAEKFQVSTSTAASWVSRARNKHGLLPPAQMGKAGI